MIFNFCIQYTWNHLFKLSDIRKVRPFFGELHFGATRHPGGHYASDVVQLYLAGGFKYFLFSPQKLGKLNPF